MNDSDDYRREGDRYHHKHKRHKHKKYRHDSSDRGRRPSYVHKSDHDVIQEKYSERNKHGRSYAEIDSDTCDYKDQSRKGHRHDLPSSSRVNCDDDDRNSGSHRKRPDTLTSSVPCDFDFDFTKHRTSLNKIFFRDDEFLKRLFLCPRPERSAGGI